MLDRKTVERTLAKIRAERTLHEKEIEWRQDRLARLQTVEESLLDSINSPPDTPLISERQLEATPPRPGRTDGDKAAANRLLFQVIKDAGAAGRTIKQIKQSLPDLMDTCIISGLIDLKGSDQIWELNKVYYVRDGKPEGAPAKGTERHLIA